MERPTMIRKIATAAVYIEDQQSAVQFWTKQVGFEVRRERPMGPDARWIEVGPPGADSCLMIYPKSLMPDWTERKPSIVFESEDIRKTFEEMRDRGVQFTQERAACNGSGPAGESPVAVSDPRMPCSHT
jgi:lactoylglutathione lyase